MTGHALGAAGVHEAVYSLLMMQHGFIAPSINIDNLDEKAVGLPIVREYETADLNTVMSNSFGFGGTNASLVFSKFKA
ncbi:3-oxoacyl-[acyl-carrier-protein] synthase 1 [compost metagenome]